MPNERENPVLFADDDENDTYFFRLALEQASVSNLLITFTSGKGVIDYLEPATYPLPSLLVLDLKMPRVSGFDVLQWLITRPSLRKIPVVILSASQQEEDIQKALALGATEYRVKPNNHSQMVTLVRELCDRWLTRTEHSMDKPRLRPTLPRIPATHTPCRHWIN
jgi:CheY-like chemotaxis protein